MVIKSIELQLVRSCPVEDSLEKVVDLKRFFDNNIIIRIPVVDTQWVGFPVFSVS